MTKRGSSASSPTAAANFCHRFSDPTATCSGDDAVANSPYGAIAGWWAPAMPGTSPPSSQRVPWKACTPTTPDSSEVRTTRPTPVVWRSCSAATTPYARFIPASRSAIGTPTLVGCSVPVTDISPPSPCAIWS